MHSSHPSPSHHPTTNLRVEIEDTTHSQPHPNTSRPYPLFSSSSSTNPPSLHIHSYSSAPSASHSLDSPVTTPAATPRRLSQITVQTHGPNQSYNNNAVGSIGSLTPSMANLGLASPRKVATNVSTFKLANVVLGYASTPCPAKSEPAYQLALDNAQHTLCVSAVQPENCTGLTHYARHLASVHSIQSDMVDHKRLIIQFRDSTRANGIGTTMLKIYAMTASEATMIIELLQLMRDEYEGHDSARAMDGSTPIPHANITTTAGSGNDIPTSPEREIADTDIIYIGRVLKRGKMSWAPRWLVLKKFHLRVYKSNKLHVPSNNISLSGAKITTNEEKDKHLTLICMDRSYTFKFSDVIERDNVMSLFHKATELRTRADGSLVALSAIGGVNPAPTKSAMSGGSFSIPASGELQRANSFNQSTGVGGGGGGDHIARRSTISVAFPSSGGPSLIGGIDARLHPSASVGSRPDGLNTANANADLVSDLPISVSSSAVKRRKSRRTISRDFQNILCKPTHALAIDETSSYPTGLGAMASGGSRAPARRIEFAEFEIDVKGAKNMERPNRLINQGVYTFMRQLADSIAGGAHLSPTLYVPKTVWYQHGAKFQAFQAKMDVLESLRVPLLSVLPPKATDLEPNLASSAIPLPSSSSSSTQSAVPSTRRPSQPQSASFQQQIADELERSLAHFRIAAEEAQDKLAQHLSFIHTVKEPFRGRGSKSFAATSSSSHAHSHATVPSHILTTTSSGSMPVPHPLQSPEASAEKLSLGEKLSKSMKTLGKIVSRAASASKDKVDHEDSTRYVKLLHSIFDQSQVFREWIVYLETGAVGQVNQPPPPTATTGSPASSQDTPPPTVMHQPPELKNRAILEEHLARISEFFYCVLCNMVIRDLKSVLKRYIKHCMRTLAAH